HYHMFVTDYPPKTMPKELEKTSKDIKKRFIINGPFANLEPIYGVGDFLIDTFPIGGGMVIVDAMACGLPIVAFRNIGFSIVSDGGGELPIDYPYLTTNYSEFVDYISQLIESSQLRKKAGEQLFNYYQQKLSPKAIGKLLYNIIEGDTTNKLIFKGQDFEKAELKYESELGQRTFLIERKNFLILDLKHFGFTLKQRLKIFHGALRNKEFKSIKEIFLFGIIAIFRKLVSFLYNFLISQKIYQSETY
ncbi:MAG: glycosyltransferase, partial [Promethearchaeota archaeon]